MIGGYTIPDPYGSLWTLVDEWGTGKINQPAADFDERVVNDGTGNLVWRFSNAVTGSFSDQPNSPSSPLVAGETTSGLYNYRGPNHTTPFSPPQSRAPATTKFFRAGFRFKSATGAAQANLALNVSPTARQSDRRMSFLSITDTGTGFDLGFSDTISGGGFASTTIQSGLSYTAWHRIDMRIEFVDGINGDGTGNDIVTVYLNGALIHTGTTWETYFRSLTSPLPLTGVNAIDAIAIRSSGTARPANAGNGLFFDDVVVDNDPEIEVTGNLIEIPAGDTLPDDDDGTDFGSVALLGGTVTRTFTINNTGSSALNLTGTAPNYVTLSGTGASHFSVSTQPTTPVAALSGTTTFTVTFDPSTAGSKTAKVRILNDDVDESVYEFDITGQGIATPDLFYTNGFENNSSDWNANAVRVASGTGGITSANGAFHAVSSATTPFTQWGGYNFGAGNAVPTTFREYRTAVSIYLDVGGGWTNDRRFDFSSAINTSAGTHRRDFIFNAGFYNDATGPGANTNRFVISTSNGSQPGSAYAKNPARDPIAISTSGWYTFSHHFYNNSSVLAVDLFIHDSSGALVKKWTLSDPSDLIANIGGNRYGWFAFNQFSTLAFDDAELTYFPEIAVELVGNVDVPDGSSVDLGVATFNGVIDTAFTIKNTGIADLKDLAVTIDGPDSSFFSVFTAPVPPVAAPAGETTLVLRFTAGSPGGVKSAVVHIANNDRDEAPFDIHVTAEAPYSAGLSGGNLTLTDSNAGNTNDNLVLSRSGSNLRIYDADNQIVAGPGTSQIDANTIDVPFADITGGITFNGISGNDILTVNLSTGNPLPPGGIAFNGGAGNDALRVVGNGQVVVYTPDAVTNGNGSIDIGGQLLTFTGLEPIDFEGVSFTLNLPNANDIVDLANGVLIDGTTPATVITGTSGGVGFENARVRSSSITINTTSMAGTDAITVTSADNAHMNTSLTLTTGVEVGDTITVNGTTTVTGTTTLNAATVALNADVTGTVTGSVATAITVASPGQIQDGINVAASTGGTLTAGAGAFAENLALTKELTMRGAQFGVDARGRVVGAPNPAVETVVAPVTGMALELQTNSNASVIDGFAFVGSHNGTSGTVGNTSGTNTGLQFKNNQVSVATGFTTSAIFMNRPAVDATFDRNEFVASTGSTQAVFLDGADAFHGLQFTNNNVLRSGALAGTGFFVDGNRNIGTSASLATPLVKGNLFQNHALGFNGGQRAFDDAEISENTFTLNTGGFAGGPRDSTITRNSFTSNSLYGLRLTSFGNTADPTRGTQNTQVTNNVFTGNGTTVDLVNGYGDVRIDDQFNGTQSTNTISGNSLGSTIGVFNRESNPEVVNFSSNWWGGSSNPETAGKILGVAAANVDYTAWLTGGTDTDLVTAGFQGDFSSLRVDDDSPQSGLTGRIQEGVNALTATGTLGVESGTYTENVDTSTKAVTLAAGASPGQVVVNGSFTLDGNDALPVEINGLAAGTDYDQWVVNGTVNLGGATLSLSGSHMLLPNQSFTIVDNDDSDAVTGTFSGLAEGAIITFNGLPLQLSYVGGSGNDVTLSHLNEIVVHDGSHSLAPELSNGQIAVVDFGSTAPNVASVRNFLVRNTGITDLAIFTITVPSGYITNGGAAVLAPGASYGFQVSLESDTPATYAGSITINHDDLNEPAFDFPVTGTVVAPGSAPVVNVGDDVAVQGTTGSPVLGGPPGSTLYSFIGSPAVNSSGVLASAVQIRHANASLHTGMMVGQPLVLITTDTQTAPSLA